MNIKALKNSKTLICITLTALICMSVLCTSLMAKADVVTVSETVNPQLTFVKINAGKTDTSASNISLWESSGSYEEDSDNGKYTIKTNSFACWYDGDHVDYAYMEIPFNYNVDDEATIIAEVTVNSWSAYSKTASAGILARSSLNARASMALAHARPEAMLMVSRTANDSYCSGNLSYKAQPKYPVRIRMTISTSSEGLVKIKSEYNFTPGNDNGWATIQSGVFMKFDKSIYIGLGASSTDKTDLATAVFSDFTVKVQANEGYQLSDDDTSSGGDSSEETESKIELPEDITPAGDVLLRETFTDGSMFDGEESAVNPIWNTTASETRIGINSDNTNRYLELTPIENSFYYAGSTDWTDYSVSVDLTFPTDISVSDSNTFTLYSRLKYNKMHGISFYSATLSSKLNTVQVEEDGVLVKKSYLEQTLTLGYCNMGQSIMNYQTALKTVNLNYLDAVDPDSNNLEFTGKTHNLKMDCLDNTITIYWDNQPVIEYTDDLTEFKNSNRIDIPAYGCIGFRGETVTVSVDNIVVRKLEDPIGEDFDNFIGGRWNEPISEDLYKYYIDNDISFY